MAARTAPAWDVAAAVRGLERHASKATRAGMARFALPSDGALGVRMADVQALARQIGRDHDLAEGLWQTGIFEARLLAAYVDDPARVTPAQMDRWCRDFDNWGICDTVCFKLFDRTPHAYKKVEQWAKRRDEFVKRGGFALMASLALHDKEASDDEFAKWFPLIEQGAEDDRNFVKKGVSWALRAIGKRNSKLKSATIKLAQRLATSEKPSARWVGKDALRDLTRS